MKSANTKTLLEVPNEVFDNLSFLRSELTWICRVITDEIYVDEGNRAGMAINISNCIERVEQVLIDLGAGPENQDEKVSYDLELIRTKPVRHGGAFGKE